MIMSSISAARSPRQRERLRRARAPRAALRWDGTATDRRCRFWRWPRAGPCPRLASSGREPCGGSILGSRPARWRRDQPSPRTAGLPARLECAERSDARQDQARSAAGADKRQTQCARRALRRHIDRRPRQRQRVGFAGKSFDKRAVQQGAPKRRQKRRAGGNRKQTKGAQSRLAWARTIPDRNNRPPSPIAQRPPKNSSIDHRARARKPQPAVVSARYSRRERIFGRK